MYDSKRSGHKAHMKYDLEWELHTHFQLNNKID